MFSTQIFHLLLLAGSCRDFLPRPSIYTMHRLLSFLPFKGNPRDAAFSLRDTEKKVPIGTEIVDNDEICYNYLLPINLLSNIENYKKICLLNIFIFSIIIFYPSGGVTVSKIF